MTSLAHIFGPTGFNALSVDPSDFSQTNNDFQRTETGAVPVTHTAKQTLQQGAAGTLALAGTAPYSPRTIN